MTRTEYLLWLLAEECAEVAQRASKAARFGLEEVQDGHTGRNIDRLREELNDLEAVWRMLHDATNGRLHTSRFLVGAKEARIKKYMDYSRQLGTLEADDAT